MEKWIIDSAMVRNRFKIQQPPVCQKVSKEFDVSSVRSNEVEARTSLHLLYLRRTPRAPETPNGLVG